MALDTGLADYTALQGCYEASSGGTVKGYVYKCSVTGYGGASTPIVYLIALDKDGTYKGYEVIDCSGETSGFGSKVAEEGFKSGIVGKLNFLLLLLLMELIKQQNIIMLILNKEGT